jgi:exodeoxyribonuclease-3
MKITTWNVNGYRAVLKKGLRDWTQQDDADVFCFQEVKARAEQIPDEERLLAGYDLFWNPAEKAGYSGVATYTRVKPLEWGLGLDDERFDNEGRVIWLKFDDFRLFNIYFPNGQRGKERVDYKLNFYSRLLDICDKLHAEGEKVVITGDFNTSHREIDLANPRQNSTVSGFLPEERVWIDKYLEHGFKDVYRDLYPDKVQYTWWTYRFGARSRNIGWRLDYYLVSESFASRVKDVQVWDQVEGSDHCPVSLIID